MAASFAVRKSVGKVEVVTLINDFRGGGAKRMRWTDVSGASGFLEIEFECEARSIEGIVSAHISLKNRDVLK